MLALIKSSQRLIFFNTRRLSAARLRDINAPKKPPSAYNIFMRERATAMRQQTLENLSSPDVFRNCAAVWRAMSQEEKEVYNSQVVGMEEY